MESSDINSVVWFHGTPYQFDTFNEMSHLGTRNAALEACIRKAHDNNLYPFTPNLMHVKISSLEDNEVIIVNDFGAPNSANLATTLIRKAEFSRLKKDLENLRTEIISKQNENGKSRSENSHIGHQLMAKFLINNGKKAILYINDVEDKGSYSIQVIDTSIIQIIERNTFDNIEVAAEKNRLLTSLAF